MRATSIVPRTELAYDESLARGLRRARLAAGYGLREAAAKLDLNLTSLWRIERSEIAPKMETLLAMVRVYGANVNIGPDGVMLTWLEEPNEEDA